MSSFKFFDEDFAEAAKRLISDGKRKFLEEQGIDTRKMSSKQVNTLARKKGYRK